MSNDNPTPEQEVNDASEETVNDEQETESEPTVGDLQDEESTPEKKVPENVPKARLDKEIQRRKELEKELESLKGDDDVPDAEKESEVKKLADKLDKIEQNEKRARAEAIFTENLNKALDNAPEFKDIVNPEVIKQMAFNPANKDKTYSQLLDEAYGNAISGKRTTESTTPRGGAKDEKVDLERARQDNNYLKEVLADPALKKQYNEGLEHRIRL